MEENIYEENMAPETEELQTPVVDQQTEEVQPAENGKDFAGMAKDLLEKGKELLVKCGPVWEKIKALPRKIWIIAGAGVAALIAVIIILSLLGNTYKTPIQTAEKLLNIDSVEKIIDRVPSLLNGFGESEAEDIIKIVKKSDQFKDVMEDAEDAFDEMLENAKDEYGKNFKINLEIDDKEKLEKDDTKEFRNKLRDISDLSEQLDDMDSDDYEDMADELGISKSQAKKLVKALKSFCKECKSASVKEGYELSLIVSLTGSELDEPEETEFTVRVFKVDGRWVPDVFSLIESIGIGRLMGMIGSF